MTVFPGENSGDGAQDEREGRVVKTDKDLLERMKQKWRRKPSLIIFDAQTTSMPSPSRLIPKLKRQAEEGDLDHRLPLLCREILKQKAHEVRLRHGPTRSAFSQNLPQLLRRPRRGRGRSGRAVGRPTLARQPYGLLSVFRCSARFVSNCSYPQSLRMVACYSGIDLGREGGSPFPLCMTCGEVDSKLSPYGVNIVSTGIDFLR